MIVIKELLSYGGVCPYQCEAITIDDKWLYIRYRYGLLTYVVANSAKEWMDNDCIDYEYSELIGDTMDGYAKHDLLFSRLCDRIEFPEGFRLESGR